MKRFLLRSFVNIVILIGLWLIVVFPFNITIGRSIQGSYQVVQYFIDSLRNEKDKYFVDEENKDEPKEITTKDSETEEHLSRNSQFKQKMRVYFKYSEDYAIMNHGIAIGVYLLLAALFKYFMKGAEVYEESDITAGEYAHDDSYDGEESFDEVKYYESLKDDTSNAGRFHDTREDKWDFK